MKRLALFLVFLASVPASSAETLKVLALQSDSFFYEKDGKLTGIEYEILEYFAKSRDAELSVEWVTSFPSLLERIGKGEADVAAGTITITPEREARVDFTTGYFPVQVVLVEPLSATTTSLVELAGSRVGAFAQTTASEALEAVDGIEVVTGSGIEGLLDGVVSGEFRAAAADSSAVIPVLEDYPSLKISLTLSEEEDFGFALPTGSPLREPLNDTISKLKQSGIYFRLIGEHMGERAGEIVRAARSQ
jgi:ABC-type amino acid transport substrate-binding protein